MLSLERYLPILDQKVELQVPELHETRVYLTKVEASQRISLLSFVPLAAERLFHESWAAGDCHICDRRGPVFV